MPDINIKETIAQNETTWRERSASSDVNVLNFAHRVVQVYGDMKLLTEKEVNSTVNMNDEEIINFLANKKLSSLSEEQKLEFCDRFVGDAENINHIPPMFWGYAYKSVRERAKNDESQKVRLDNISRIIDKFARNFDTSGGLVIDAENQIMDGVTLNFVDVTNIADVYEGFKGMLDARRADVSDDMREVYDRDNQKLEGAIAAYDDQWGLTNVKESNADAMAARYDDLINVADKAQLSDETYRLISQTKFLDADGNVDAQFVNSDGEKHTDWQSGDRLIKGGRVATMVDFARIDYVKKNLGRTDEEIDEQAAENEINESVLEKLYELDVADKIARGAQEKPDQFTNPENFKQFVQNLSQNGGTVSDVAYQATVDKEINGLAGFFSRVKTKLGNGFKKLGNAISGLFNRVKPNDKLAATRTSGTQKSKREKRIEFFVRILKGLGLAFLASALITVVASAAAAVAGVSLAVGLAIVGVMTSVALSAIQIHKWRKAQRENGLPDDLKTMLKDKRLVASLGVSGLAATAMIFGAFGMPTVAAAFGYTALAAGAGKNAIETFKDAKSNGMSTTESIIWSIFNAGAVVAGGFAGRAVGTAIVEGYNASHPDNTIFQNKETVEQRTIEHHSETHEVYTQDALDHAKNICESWYRNNPDLLQSRVDAINAYNAEHGTNIDPYRAILINADAGGITPDNNLLHVQNAPDIHSGGHHKVLTDYWAKEYGVDKSIINNASHLFNADGSVNPDGIDAVNYLDGFVSAHNEVGFMPGITDAQVVDGHAVQNDHVLHDNVVVNGESRHSVFADGTPAKETIVNEWDTEVVNNYDVYTPTTTPLMAAYGNLNMKDRGVDVQDRMGAKPDTIVTRQGETQRPQEPEQPVTPVKPDAPEKPNDDVVVIDGGNHEAPVAFDGEVQDDVKEPVFGMTIEDADKFFKLQWQIERDEKALSKGPKKSEADKIKTRLTTNKQNLNKMRNELGRPTDDEITDAINDAWVRKDILGLQEKIANVEKNWPEKNQRQRDDKVLQIEIYKEEIEKLGGEKMLDTSNLVYYKPVKGDQRMIEESRGNPVKIKNDKDYEYSEGNVARVVENDLSEKQNIDDERRTNAHQKKSEVVEKQISTESVAKEESTQHVAEPDYAKLVDIKNAEILALKAQLRDLQAQASGRGQIVEHDTKTRA